MKPISIFLIAAFALFTACGGCSDETGSKLNGETCEDSDECRGECTGGECEGFGDAGYDGESCNSDEDCRGTCGDTGECEGGGDAPNNSNNANNTNNSNNANNVTNNNTVFDTNDNGQVLCGNDPCACDDGMDNDGDGLIDGFDPECTGPYDDDEATFATGIPGDNKDPKWQDCFFDGNSGAGDDRCRYHTECLTGEKTQDDPDCVLSQQCIDFCFPRTPNGCDCFGCCEVATGDGASTFVIIGSECSLDDLSACQTCEQSTQCVNECGECELCLGKTLEDLPDSCSNGGGFTGDPCNVDSECRGLCSNGSCDGHGSGGGNGDQCMLDADCRGVCGVDMTCNGGGGGFTGDPCTDDTDCRGVCGGNDTCDGYGSGGFDGEPCMGDDDCRGSCGGDNTCTGGGNGSGSGLQCDDGTPCTSDGQCAFNEYCQQGCCTIVQL